MRWKVERIDFRPPEVPLTFCRCRWEPEEDAVCICLSVSGMRPQFQGALPTDSSQSGASPKELLLGKGTCHAQGQTHFLRDSPHPVTGGCWCKGQASCLNLAQLWRALWDSWRLWLTATQFSNSLCPSLLPPLHYMESISRQATSDSEQLPRKSHLWHPLWKIFGKKINKSLSKILFKFFPNPRILSQWVKSSSIIKTFHKFANVWMTGLRCSVALV